MVNYRKIIELKDADYSNSAIAVNVGYSRNTVAAVINLAQEHNLKWPLPEDLSNYQIEKLFLLMP